MSQPARQQRVGYVRVSTASGEQLAALENQRARIEAAGVDLVLQDIQSGRAIQESVLADAGLQDPLSWRLRRLIARLRGRAKE